MKFIPLTYGKFAIVDDADYELTSKFKWSSINGTNTDYAICSVHLGYLHSPTKKRIKCTLRLHRLIMRPPKAMEVDHINHNGLDCRRSNMRICTKAQNQYNKYSHIGSSRYKGVSWDKDAQKWRADIHNNGRHITLGKFYDEIDAALAYDEAAIKYAGEFAFTNFTKSEHQPGDNHAKSVLPKPKTEKCYRALGRV